jgi:hypothetical protein
MEKMNLHRHPAMSGLPLPSLLSSKEFQELVSKGAVILGTRMPNSVAGAYIKGSISIWLEGLAFYAGRLLPHDIPIFLLLEERAQVESAFRALVRIGTMMWSDTSVAV